jgi:hypothetical protein
MKLIARLPVAVRQEPEWPRVRKGRTLRLDCSRADDRFRRRRDSGRGDTDGRVLSKAGTKWSAMARPGDDLAALERAQLFGSDIQAPHTRAAERFRATGGRTGELREDWQGAFVVTHIDRAGLIMQGAH